MNGKIHLSVNCIYRGSSKSTKTKWNYISIFCISFISSSLLQTLIPFANSFLEETTCLFISVFPNFRCSQMIDISLISCRALKALWLLSTIMPQWDRSSSMMSQVKLCPNTEQLNYFVTPASGSVVGFVLCLIFVIIQLFWLVWFALVQPLVQHFSCIFCWLV